MVYDFFQLFLEEGQNFSDLAEEYNHTAPKGKITNESLFKLNTFSWK